MPARSPASPDRSRFLRPVHAGLVVSALLLLWIGQYTDLDLALADAMYDRASGTFPWQHAWLAENFNHRILKIALQILGVATVVTAAWDYFRPQPRWRASWRAGIRVLALSAIAVPVVISVLKRFSVSHCPWDLQRYGGREPYIRLLEAMPANIDAGHCMPAGHASSALWLLGLAAFWLPHRPRMAAAVAALMLVFAFGVGWMQQLRGAHFLTHTLWSVWIAVLIVDVLCRRLIRPAQV